MRLVLQDIHHTYSPGTPFAVEALRGVSLAVEPGEVLGILGGTGSGKSTLVQHMNLLLQPASGTVLVDGGDAAKVEKSELRRRVGMVFQFPEAALFAPTVWEDVAFAPHRLGLEEAEAEKRVRQSLALVGAEHLKDRSPFALSGGEQRRVAIAGVLAMGPETLVLDEPTSGLDPASRQELLRLIRTLRDTGTSVVLVSHDTDEIAEVADRICILERGKVRDIGSPGDIFYANPDFAPSTVGTVAALSATGWDTGRPVRFGETLRALAGLMKG